MGDKSNAYSMLNTAEVALTECFIGLANDSKIDGGGFYQTLSRGRRETMDVATDRLIIRRFEREDWLAILEYTSNRSVMKYMPAGVFDDEKAIEFIRKNMGEEAQNFAVILKNSGKLIGHIVFLKYFGEHTYEIGWVFNPRFHNQGYASEAAQGIVEYGFKEMNLHRIIATCQPENIPSWRVMEKIGMRREGYFQKCIPHGNEWWDEYYYAILREEWDQQSGTSS